MYVTQSRAVVPAVERAGAASESVRTGATRPSGVRIALGLIVVASLAWLIAAPSTPAVIALVSALIASIGWGDDSTEPLPPAYEAS